MLPREEKMQSTNFQVLAAKDIKERSRWLEIWLSWPRHDIFAHPDFVRIHESEFEKAFAAVYKTEKGTILYPFLKRNLGALDWIPKEFFSWIDLSSSYGYGGAYYWGDDTAKAEVSDNFWKVYNEWVEKENCISEFIRFHLFDQDLAVYPGEKIMRSKNIVRTLMLSEDNLWMDFEQKVRKNIKKSQRSRLECIIDEDGRYLDDFLKIYESTMTRRKATDFYYFNRNYFETISKNLSDNSAYFHVLDNGKIVSTELVIYSSQTVYSFLGGTADEAFNKRPNDLLKYHVMIWAREHRISNYVLGGGYAPEDGVYRYKKSFAPHGEYDFYTGQRIINLSKYKKLIDTRRNSLHGVWQPQNGYFPQYRS